jgi:hypothetical protein
MANANTKFGLRPVRYLSGAPYNGAVNAYSVPTGDSTAIYIGDPVKLAGTAQTIGDQIYQDIAQAAVGDKCLGAVVGMSPVLGSGASGRDSTIYRAASTQRVIYVADDPNLVFEIQEVGTGTAFTANDIGLNASYVVGSGSTTTGLSGVELDNTTEATTNTLDLQIVGFVNRPGNEIGANAKWLVRINNHQRANQVAGV